MLPDLACYVPTLENGGAYYVGTGDDKHLVVKYKLKRGVKWFDGQEVTSNDVIFTYKLWLNPNFPAGRALGLPAAVRHGRQPRPVHGHRELPDLEGSRRPSSPAIRTPTASCRAIVDNKIPVTDPLYNEILVGYRAAGALAEEHRSRRHPAAATGRTPRGAPGRIT